MIVDQKVLFRLDELINVGEKVLSTRRSPGPNVLGDDRVDTQIAYQWATSVQNLLARVFGQNSEHYKNFVKQTEKRMSYSPAYCAQGILKAAKDDFEQGYLFNVKKLIEAEIFDDFIEQGEHLNKLGYFQAAAVVIGCVLEDGLRKLCHSNSIPIADKPKLDKMNADLSKAGIYNKLTQKKITAIADLRNKAAHGQWDQFNKDDVEDMIRSVRRFMEDFFS